MAEKEQNSNKDDKLDTQGDKEEDRGRKQTDRQTHTEREEGEGENLMGGERI